MGRGKIEIKKIDNATSRQVTFSKRRNGILKKAFELSILCDVEIGVLIFSPTGKVFQYASSSMDDIWARYRGLPEEQREKTSRKHENAEVLGKEIKKLKREIESLKQLDGQGTESLSVEELRQLEKRMESSISKIRERKEELMVQEIEHLRQKVEMAQNNALSLPPSNVQENPLILLNKDERNMLLPKQSPLPSPSSSLSLPKSSMVPFPNPQLSSTFPQASSQLSPPSPFLQNHFSSTQMSSSSLQFMSDKFPSSSSQFSSSSKISPVQYSSTILSSSQFSSPKVTLSTLSQTPVPQIPILQHVQKLEPSHQTTLDLLEKDDASRKVRLPQTTLHLGLYAGWEYDESELSMHDYDLNMKQEDLHA